MRDKDDVVVTDCWAPLEAPQVLLVPSPDVFAYYLGVLIIWASF